MPNPQDIVRQFVANVNDAANGGNVNPYALLAPDVLVTINGFTPLSGNYHGRSQVQHVLADTLMERFSEASVEITETIGSGTRFAALGIISGVGASGRKYNEKRDTDGFVFDVKDGKIIEAIEDMDTSLTQCVIFDQNIVPRDSA